MRPINGARRRALANMASQEGWQLRRSGIRLLVIAITLLLCVALASTGRFSDIGSNSMADAAPPITREAPRRPAAYGINPYTVSYWGNERSFMNLAAGGVWNSIRGKWSQLPSTRLGPDGNLRAVEPGESVALALTRPPPAYHRDVPIRCRFEGRGKVGGVGMLSPKVGPKSIDFIWPRTIEIAHFVIEASDAADPIRGIDCREADADPKKLFDPLFVESVRPFKVIRFLDWQAANLNIPLDWSKRTSPAAPSQAGAEGVAVEHLVALANEAGTDPWFVMPWNATPAYMENFARYVRDHLNPQRTIYVEIGNETWNPGFPVGRQLADEGLRAKLGATRDEARMRRYAQGAVAGFKIWERVFAASPKRIVRVLSGQNAWPDLFLHAINYQDTARHVDAISSAVYFGMDTLTDAKPGVTDLQPLFDNLNASMDRAFGEASRFKQMADERGLRYIAYEGGQHMIYKGPDRTLTLRMNRDPRMGDVYRRYMSRWGTDFGDLLVLYASVNRMNPDIHFGLSEYSGQPLAETPKRRAVLEMLKR